MRPLAGDSPGQKVLALGGAQSAAGGQPRAAGQGRLRRMQGWRGKAPPASPTACRTLSLHVCLGPLTLFSVPGSGTHQNMEKAIVPSVALIVGCGVSSLTLLMLIIIYVSVWRCCF